MSKQGLADALAEGFVDRRPLIVKDAIRVPAEGGFVMPCSACVTRFSPMPIVDANGSGCELPRNETRGGSQRRHERATLTRSAGTTSKKFRRPEPVSAANSLGRDVVPSKCDALLRHARREPIPWVESQRKTRWTS